MKTILKLIFKYMFGKIKYQKIFEQMYRLSLQGMNIGGDAINESSGEKFVIEHLYSKLKGAEKITIFDVGANIGDYTILISTIFKKNTDVYAFEPSIKTYEKFRANTKNIANLYPYNLGFGNENTKIALYSNEDESGLASLYKRRLDHIDIQMHKTEEIEITTIDNFCSQKNIKKINLLKIDVEGHEYKVLEGAKKMISSNGIDFIQFEFGGTNIDSRTFFQDFYYLLKEDYYIYRIVKDGLFKINNYDEKYELFTFTNFLAERINKTTPYSEIA